MLTQWKISYRHSAGKRELLSVAILPAVFLTVREFLWYGGREAEMHCCLCIAGDVDPKASEQHSPCWAVHKAPIIAVWATLFASHWKCCLVHQHRQLKNKRGKTSACLFKMLSKRREAGDLKEKGRFVVSSSILTLLLKLACKAAF